MDSTPPRFDAGIARSLPLEIGTVIGECYKIRKVLGYGGFGVVYLVEHLGEGSLYAMKVLRDSAKLSPSKKHAFEKEAKVWLSLANHPFVVALHHVQIYDGQMSIVMEYIPQDGEGLVTLFDHIAFTPEGIGDQQLGWWAIQFCHAMEHGASKGLVAHRDIKPLNILVEPSGFLKLSDFGLASALSSVLDQGASTDQPMHASAFVTHGGSICCGTPGFIAPELFDGASASIESDIFSFGVVMWQMAAGKNSVPFPASFDGDLLDFQRRLLALQRRHAVTHVDSMYWEIICRCLHPNPRERFASFSEVRASIVKSMKGAGLRVIDFLINAEGLLGLTDFVNKGASFSLLGQHDKALEYLNRALDRDPKSVHALVNRGNNWLRMGRNRAALGDYEQALAIRDDAYPALIGRSDCYVKEGNYRSALADIERAFLLKPNSPETLWRRGLLLGMVGRVEAAIVDMEWAVRLSPKDARLWTHLGSLLRKRGSVEAATDCFSEAIRHDNNYLPAYLAQGRLLFEQGERPEGLAFFQRVLGFFAPDIESLNAIAVVMSDAGAPSEAIEVFDSLLRRDPSHAHVLLCNIGNAQLEMSNLDAAIEYFQRSIAANRLYALPHLRLADTLASVGDYLASIEFYDKAMELEPDSFDAWFGGGAARLHMGEADAAATLIKRAVTLQPHNARAWYNLAASNAVLGRLDECSNCLGKAIECEPTYAKAWYLKAQIDMHEGNRTSALRSCAEANRFAEALDQTEAANVEEWLAQLAGENPE